MNLIRAGQADVVLTGGSESMLCFGGIKAWEGLRVMSKDGCRPFSLNRNGMVQGEGAAVFVFEELEHARARGAEILAEVTGFAMTSDASDIVTPNLTARCGRCAARCATPGLRRRRSATSTPTAPAPPPTTRPNARRSARSSAPHADRLMISSTKSMHGHLIGGTGAVELVACLMALREGVIAPDDQLRRARPRVRPRRGAERRARAPGRRGDDQRLRLRRAERGAGAQGLRLSVRERWVRDDSIPSPLSRPICPSTNRSRPHPLALRQLAPGDRTGRGCIAASPFRSGASNRRRAALGNEAISRSSSEPPALLLRRQRGQAALGAGAGAAGAAAAAGTAGACSESKAAVKPDSDKASVTGVSRRCRPRPA